MPSFPANGGGGTGTNTATIYASPLGNDGNDGLSTQQAVKTGYVGYQKIVAAGGGVLNIADGTSWGGPVPGQGAWFRGDGKAIPGFLPAVPCIINGLGGGPAQQLFSEPGQIQLKCGSNDAADFRTKPGIWHCVSDVNTIEFRNIRPIASDGHHGDALFSALFRSWRIGWDYPRKSSDGSIDYLTITSSQRAANVTQHTASLQSPGIAVTTAQRISGVTRLTIPRPAGFASFPPYNSGFEIWFESTDVNITSGAKTITHPAWLLDITADWSFSFDDPGPDYGPVSSPGHVRYTECRAFEFIDVESNSAQFPSTQYEVTAVSYTNSTTAVITVADPYGGHNGVNASQSATPNIGRLVHQERGFGEVALPKFYNCNGLVTYTDVPSRYEQGPTWDFGACNAGAALMDRCFIQGYFPDSGYTTNVYDKNRMSAIFCYGGVEGAAGLTIRNCTGNIVCVRFITGLFNGALDIDGLTAEVSNGYAPPLYEIDATQYMPIRINHAGVADALPGFGAPIIRGPYDPLNLSGNSVPTIPCVGPASDAYGTLTGWQVPGGFEGTPWTFQQVATWGDGKVSGKHPAAWRGISPAAARFANMTQPYGSWTTLGTATTGQSDPVGGTGAVKLVQTGGVGPSSFTIYNGVDGVNSWAAGGRFVIASWINFPASDFNLALLMGFTGGGDVTWVPQKTGAQPTGSHSWFVQCPTAIPGWQFVVAHNVVATASASQDYSVQLVGPAAGGDSYFFEPSCFYVPPSVSDADFYEFIGTLKAQPQYLPKGMAGTFPSQKFIAHGGIGTDSTNKKTVGVGSGQLTLTGSGTVYLPMYDKDGTTIIGWVAQLQATVNP